MKDATSSIREQSDRTPYREHSTPLFLTSSFVYDNAEHAQAMFAGEADGYIYSRFSNPNTSEFISKMNALEGTEAGVATASGMAAIFNTLATHLTSGDHVIACSSLFGNSLYIIKEILPKWGIEFTLVAIDAPEQLWHDAVQKNSKLVLVETPSNPGLGLIDLDWFAKFSQTHRLISCVDNCFATPIVQKPAHYGVDLIIHSATKWIDGQGRVLGGIVQGKEEYVTPIYDFLRRTGACMSPFNAWLLSKSLETLEIRMEKHCQNAMRLASHLNGHHKIKNVAYPYLDSHPQYELACRQMKMGGGIVTLHLDANQQKTFEVINALKIPSITANLGDTRTIVTHPATTTHSKLSNEEQVQIGITEGTLRISVGLENIDDLVDDFDKALSFVL